ncbi:18403_t:CDS:2 [Gigaspora margarita]|uniref:18403_t:CDS:1 n=1 Tax=Gigaspora margarita TaxID=4874 RepID=A0ABN7ULE8_GIGMA|nr:18403_t:CDS:2 [Gigaspora margarita]
MPPLSKGKRKTKNQCRNAEGRFCNSRFSDLYNRDEDELNINDRNESKDIEWGDEEDSGWDDIENIETELNLIWKMIATAAGIKKITSFFNNVESQVANSQPLESNDLDVDKILSDSKSETNSYIYKINKKIENLKKELEQNHNKLTVKEYSYKRAIFEYLSLLSYNNGRGKIKASLEVS